MAYNFKLSDLPHRTDKVRDKGVTMVMDKGVSIRQAEDYLSMTADFVDFVKLGFGSSIISNDLKQKIRLYQENNIKVYLGGTLFEAFVVRNKFEDYMRLLDQLKLDTAEVSDGSLEMPHDEKLKYIAKLAKNYTVFSEVGSKEEGIIIHPNKWIKLMSAELEAGSWKVIAEARESGNVGIFHRNGAAHVVLINKITAKVPADKILWETPQKGQQVYFINLFGANVNVGNISFDDVIPLETLRIGLRADTFYTFLKGHEKETN
jgi:phosphosulfolactate synthase